MILGHFIYYCCKFHTDAINQTVFGKEFVKLVWGKWKLFRATLSANIAHSNMTSVICVFFVQVQKLKEKSVTYRLETEDYLSEYKYRTDSKVRPGTHYLLLPAYAIFWKTLVNKLLFTLQHFWTWADCSAVVPDTLKCSDAVEDRMLSSEGKISRVQVIF